MQAAVCDVRSFGATGNGTTDDSNAVEAAFACAAASTPTGGVVLFPAGTYKLATPKNVFASNLTVRFDGATILNGTAAGPYWVFYGNDLLFDGSVTLDQGNLAAGGLAFSLGRNAVWRARTTVTRGASAPVFALYRATGTVFENIFTNDSLLMFLNQPRQLRVANVRVALTSAVDGVILFVGGGDDYLVRDLQLSDIDIDLGGFEVTSAIVLSVNYCLDPCPDNACTCPPNRRAPHVDGVQITNLSIRNNHPNPVAQGGDGIDIIRCDHVSVTNATFRDLNVNGINASGSYMTLSNIVGSDCGAPCVQVHDPSDPSDYTTVTLENIVVVNGGKRPHPLIPYSGAGVSVSPYILGVPTATGTISNVKLHNVTSFGSLSQYGFAVTPQVTNVTVDGTSFGGSLGTALLYPGVAHTVSFNGPTEGPAAGTLYANNFWGGASWLRVDPTKGAAQASVDNLGRLAVSSAPIGSGAISFTNTLLSGADGSLQWAGGAPVKRQLSKTWALNLPAPASVPGCVTSGPQGFKGALTGDVAATGLSVPLPAGQQVTARAIAPDTVQIAVCQFSGAAVDPDGAGATYRVDLWQH